jgi:polyisoprenoid-binding protein YceI
VTRSRPKAERWFVAAAVLAAGIAGPIAAQDVTALPLRSGEITFFTRVANAPDFTGRVPVAAAGFRGNHLTNVSGFVELRAAEMRTGIGARDGHLRSTMDADSFPLIRFDLVGLDPRPPTGDTVAVTFQGHLTIHGVTKTIRVPGTVVVRPSGIEVVARFLLDMREYGIDPPVRLLARVQPVVEITARLSFGR